MSSTSASAEAVALGARARVGVTVVFVTNGLAFASWASRAPAVQRSLDLDASGLGLLLVCMSVGSTTAMPMCGAVVHRFGPARSVLAGALLEAGGFLIAALGLAVEAAWLTGVGLLVFGLGISVWDVAMNVEAAGVEQRLDRSIMPRFHAGWSLGTVIGAGLGAAAAWLGVPVGSQLVAAAVALPFLAAFGARSFTPPAGVASTEGPSSRSLLRSAWSDRRTLVVGLLVLSFAFSEGVANDWTAVAIVKGLGDSETAGAVGFGVFVAAMTLARLVGVGVLDRWGRVRALRASALCAGVGVVLVVFGPALGWVLAGTALWGAGTAIGFPTGISAAADSDQHAAIHVSVVSSIGYTAFLAGPPLVGFLGDALGVRHGLSVVLVGLLLAVAAASATRKPA